MYVIDLFLWVLGCGCGCGYLRRLQLIWSNRCHFFKNLTRVPSSNPHLFVG